MSAAIPEANDTCIHRSISMPVSAMLPVVSTIAADIERVEIASFRWSLICPIAVTLEISPRGHSRGALAANSTRSAGNHGNRLMSNGIHRRISGG